MVMANTERVGKGLDLLRDGLGPACEATWRGFYGDGWPQQVNSRLHHPDRGPSVGDSAFLFKGVKATWNEVFSHGFGPSVRSLVFEVSDVRNRWAHQQSLTSDDTVRALDSMERVLEAFGNSDQRDQIRVLRRDLMRQMFDEESRSERRRTAAKPTEGTPHGGLTPWREIITPHADVAAGRFEQAEYAADLALVAAGGAEPEYQDPHSFYSRTYITQGLHDLLAGAARRLSGQGGDPVIELQTNFGGGKTHSLIALYHLASGTDQDKLPGLADVLSDEGLTLPPKVNRAVLVGMDLDRRGLWSERGDIAVHKLWETYARFCYMPRLASRDVLYRAIANRDSTITWLQDTFAHAETHDDERWAGLNADNAVQPAPSGLLIRPDRIPAAPDPQEPDGDLDAESDVGASDSGGVTTTPSPDPSQLTRFYAQFNLDPVRCIKRLGEIADHVSSRLGPDLELVLEVRATSDEGFGESTRRTVSENARSLGARSTEFE